MPKPNFTLISLGMWERCDLPTRPAYEVLIHLTQPGDPLLFVHEGERGSLSCRLTNTESAPGRSTQIDVRRLISSHFVEIDREQTERCIRGMRAYRITNKGREAIVQFEAYGEYRRMLELGIPPMLERLRSQYGAPPYKKG